MQELFEYYFIGVIFTMVPGSPSGQGPAGQGGSVSGSGHGSGSVSGSGTTDPLNTSSSGSSTFSFTNIDDLLSKLNRQLEIGVGISEKDALKNLNKSIAKLNGWDKFVLTDLSNKLRTLSNYNEKFSNSEYKTFKELVLSMLNNSTDPGKKHISLEEYANIQKNLVNENRDSYNRLFSMYKKIVPRIEDTKTREEFSNLIHSTQKDMEFKLGTKLDILKDIKENSRILRELEKKKQ